MWKLKKWRLHCYIWIQLRYRICNLLQMVTPFLVGWLYSAITSQPQCLETIICKVFLALFIPFNYICTSANVNHSRCKIFKQLDIILLVCLYICWHISFRAFSKIILYWNLDNFDTGVMSKKRPRQWYPYPLIGIAYHLAWALLIISVGQSRASIE